MKPRKSTNAGAEPLTPPRYVAALVFVAFLNALCYPLITIGLGYAPHLSFAILWALVAGSTLALVAALLGRPVPRDRRFAVRLGSVGSVRSADCGSHVLTDGHHEFKRRTPAASDDAILTAMERGRVPHEVVADRLFVHDRPERAAKV